MFYKWLCVLQFNNVVHLPAFNVLFCLTNQRFIIVDEDVCGMSPGAVIWVLQEEYRMILYFSIWD